MHQAQPLALTGDPASAVSFSSALAPVTSIKRLLTRRNARDGSAYLGGPNNTGNLLQTDFTSSALLRALPDLEPKPEEGTKAPLVCWVRPYHKNPVGGPASSAVAVRFWDKHCDIICYSGVLGSAALLPCSGVSCRGWRTLCALLTFYYLFSNINEHFEKK